MKEYNCQYIEGYDLNIGDNWERRIQADSPRKAYEEFIKDIGAYPNAVSVRSGIMSENIIFEDHVAKPLQTIKLLQDIIDIQNEQALALKKINWKISLIIFFAFVLPVITWMIISIM